MRRITSVDCPAPSGTSRSRPPNAVAHQNLFKEVEGYLKKKFVGVCIFGEESGDGVRIGTTSDAAGYAATGQSWNKRPTVIHALLWCVDRASADKVVAELKRDLAPNHLHDSWYDLAPYAAELAATFAAKTVNVMVFDEAAKQAAIESHVMKRISNAAIMRDPQLLKNVVPANRRVF